MPSNKFIACRQDFGMKREEHKIDQFFRDGLRDHESPLAAHLWDKLDAAREEDKKPKGIIWWKWSLGASLLVLLIAAATFYLLKSEKKESDLPSKNSNTNSPITANQKTGTLNQVTDAVENSEQIINHAKVATIETASAEMEFNQENKSERTVISAKPLTKKERVKTTTNSSLENSNSNSTNAFLIPTENSSVEKKTNNKTINTSSQFRETKLNISQPIALTLEAQPVEAIKATQALNFINTNAMTLLDNAPDLQTAFAAPPIKIPFSRGPTKGCYSFAGGRIKYDYYVDAFLSPEYVIRNLSAKTAEDENYRRRRDDTEATLYGLSGGVRLSVVTRRGLALRTGVVYNRIMERFKLEKEGDVRIVQIVPAGTTDTITSIETGTTVVRSYNRYHAIDIPLLLGYEIEAGKFNFSINAGAYFNIYARQKGKILSQSDTPEFITSNNPQRINAFKKDLGISVYGSVGLNYQIRPNLQLLIEPNLRYQLKPISLETYPLEQQYINVGLLLGVRRQF